MEATVASAFGSSLNQTGQRGDPSIESFRAPPPTRYECHNHEIARVAAKGPRRPQASFRSKTARLPDPRSRAPGPGAYEHTPRSASRSPGCSMRGAPRDQQCGSPLGSNGISEQWLYRTLDSRRRMAEKPTLDLRLVNVASLKAAMVVQYCEGTEGPPQVLRRRSVRSSRGHECRSSGRTSRAQPSTSRGDRPDEAALMLLDRQDQQLLQVGNRGQSRRANTVIHPEVPCASFVSESTRKCEFLSPTPCSPDEVGPGYYDTLVADICIAGRKETPQSKEPFGCKSPRFSDQSNGSPDLGPGVYNPQHPEHPRAPSRSRVAPPAFNLGGNRWSLHPRSESADVPGPGRYKPHKRPASSAATTPPGVGFGIKADRFKDPSHFPEDLRSDTVQCWYRRSATPGAQPRESESPVQRTMQGLNKAVRDALRNAEAASPGDAELDKSYPTEFLDPDTPDLTHSRFQPASEAFLATEPRWARSERVVSPLGPGDYDPQAPGARRSPTHDFGIGPPRAVSVPLDFYKADAVITSHEQPLDDLAANLQVSTSDNQTSMRSSLTRRLLAATR